MAIRGQTSEHPSIHQGLCHMPVGFRHKVCPGASFPWGPSSITTTTKTPVLGLELTALTALLEDLGAIPSTNTVARKHL